MLTSMEWTALWISVKVALASVAIDLPFAIAVGYVLARGRGRGKTVVESIVNLPLVLPPVVTGYLMLLLLGKNGWIGSILYNVLGVRLTFTWFGASLASAVVCFPLMVRSIRQAFLSVDRRYEQMSQSLGAPPLMTFFTISLPLAYRGVVSGCVLGFARSLGEFGATMMVAGNMEGLTQTIPLAIYSLVQRPGGVADSYRLVAVSIVISCIALLLSERMDNREAYRERTSF